MSYTISTTLDRPHDETVEAVREALSEQGFGILTEIDLAGALKEKLGVDIAPQLILGACRPPLAYAALQADPSIGALLPCNVVVRSLDAETTIVEALDPDTMTTLADDHDDQGSDRAQAVRDVASDAKERLNAAFASLQTPATAATRTA